MLDLIAIKARRAKDYRVSQNEVVSHILFGQAFADIDALLLEVERLTNENTAIKSAFQEADAYLYSKYIGED